MQLNLALARSTAAAASEHVLRVAAMFGLGLDEQRRVTVIPPTSLDLLPNQVVLITGPSGSGKSSMLGLIDDALRDRPGVRVLRFDNLAAPADRPLVDCFDGASLEDALRWLSLAGLGDAFVMLRQPGELSDGQRYRFRLAQVMHAVETSPTSASTVVLADEFGATLDRLTAGVIARNVRKWVTRTPAPVCFVAATTHDDLLEALSPDVLVYKDLGAHVEVAPCPAGGSLPRFTDDAIAIEPGTMRDYAVLAEHHYRSNRPATATRVLAARRRGATVVGRYLQRRDEAQLVGVLVESLPSLSCTLRDVALGGRYAGLRDVRARAALLNAEVRCISRVVVHPQWRGLGVAVRLVRAALESKTTLYTEALAAMGHVNPFFERAGMTAYRRPPHPADARLVEALRVVGLSPIDLASLEHTTRRIEALPGAQRALVTKELRRWRRGAPWREALDAARRRLACEPVYYLFSG